MLWTAWTVAVCSDCFCIVLKQWWLLQASAEILMISSRNIYFFFLGCICTGCSTMRSSFTTRLCCTQCNTITVNSSCVLFCSFLHFSYYCTLSTSPLPMKPFHQIANQEYWLRFPSCSAGGSHSTSQLQCPYGCCCFVLFSLHCRSPHAG